MTTLLFNPLFLSAALLILTVHSFSVSPHGNTRLFSKAAPLQATCPLVVALTREQGKNFKLEAELVNVLGDIDGVIVRELPCIAHADGADFDQLAPTLERKWDYVAITSPEAARVLSQAWLEGADPPSIAAVGKATQATLEKLGIPVDFCPSKATAATLVEELPAKGDRTTLLYPTTKASSTLEDGLAARGFDVTRLNTYDTVTAEWTSEEQTLAATVHVACFGSPSAVKGWLKNTGDNKEVLAACIGETSAAECRKQQWHEDKIFYPEKPGIPGWAASVKEALETIQVAHA